MRGRRNAVEASGIFEFRLRRTRQKIENHFDNIGARVIE
jgi:hypothetical protein